MKKTLQSLALATVLICFSIALPRCHATDDVPATSGPMPQTREHILLARQVGVPLNLILFGQPDPPLVSPLLGLLGTTTGWSGDSADGTVDHHDYAIWQRLPGFGQRELVIGDRGSK